MLNQAGRESAGTNQRVGGHRSGLSVGRLSTRWTGPEEERPPDWCMKSLQD